MVAAAAAVVVVVVVVGVVVVVVGEHEALVEYGEAPGVCQLQEPGLVVQRV